MGTTVPILSLSGPSGVGKSTALRRLKPWNYIRVIPSTTRSRRPKESLEAYRFLTLEEYQQKSREGEMKLSFFFFDNFYGYQNEDILSVISAGSVPIFEVYTSFVEDFKEEFPTARSIFMIPESIELLEERMRNRGDNLQSVEKRVSYAYQEIGTYQEFRHLFDYSIMVGRQDTPKDVEQKLLEILKNVPKI